jgi:hypothetical protein
MHEEDTNVDHKDYFFMLGRQMRADINVSALGYAKYANTSSSASRTTFQDKQTRALRAIRMRSVKPSLLV